MDERVWPIDEERVLRGGWIVTWLCTYEGWAVVRTFKSMTSSTNDAITARCQNHGYLLSRRCTVVANWLVLNSVPLTTSLAWEDVRRASGDTGDQLSSEIDHIWAALFIAISQSRSSWAESRGRIDLDRYRPTSDNSAAYNEQHLLRFELHSFGYIPP